MILDLDEPVSVDFRLVKDNEYATALHHFTGSKDHNVRMRQIAKARGEKISEYGVEQEDGTVLTFQDEAAFLLILIYLGFHQAYVLEQQNLIKQI